MTEMIDTLEAMKRFQGAGFPEPQAHALVEVFRDLGRQSQASLATKEDLRVLEARFSDRFEHLEGSIDARFEHLEGSIDARFEHLEGSIDARYKHLEGSIDARFESLGGSIDARLEHLEGSIDGRFQNARLEAHALIATTKTDLIRWTIGSQMILVAALAALSNFTKVFG